MDRSRSLRARVLAGASMLALAASTMALAPSATVPAVASADEGEGVYRQEALAHARAISEAWRRLEGHILRRSAAATVWTGSIPPAGTGWLDAWTQRGVRARYCDDTLLVYMEPASLKGVGRDHRAVQVAPHLYAPGELAALHWLAGGVAEGTAGRAGVTLPACLGEASFGGPLPSGRAALAGAVRDPHLELRDRIAHERTEEACPAGSHGRGHTMTREVRQAHDGRGDPVGDPVVGSWQVLIDDCRADYTEWEHYTLPCEWDAGPPHNRRMQGQEIWRREKTVTAVGTAWGTPEFVSTSCWEGRTPALPQATVSETVRTETSSRGCPAGFTGTVALSRTVTTRSTRWPWDAQPVVQEIPGNWIADESGCSEVPRQHVHVDFFPTGGGPGVGTGPGGGQCGTPGPSNGGGDGPGDGPGEGTCSGPGVGPGSGGGNGGGCFLTEAVVGHRGVEADDGPTLTALRAFRDGYMTRTAQRRAMVERYYEIAPAIVAAIPAGHPEWEWIGGRIDAALAAIGGSDEDAAFAIYAGMVRRLTARWLDGEGGAASAEGSGAAS